jgi:predicted phage baseplate assembly protein
MNTLECRDERRRALIRQTDQGTNGLDYLEVDDDQLTLTVYFLRKAPPEVSTANIRIDGGRRIRGIRATQVRMCRQDDPELDDCMIVTVDRFGDFSTYRLCLVEPDERGRPGTTPLAGFDPRYACVDFTFKVNCPSDFDCAPEHDCGPPAFVEPALNYLAKDYNSFRQLIFDRLALIMPEWRERHEADVGGALAELLAYTGDYLSYYQDAVATEAYLDTARLRTSVRRHARLVDYRMHEGCNARAWVCVETDVDVTLPPDVSFITGLVSLAAGGRELTWPDLQNTRTDQYEVFEPLEHRERPIYAAHNRIQFYTWGDRDCCLPAGSITATLLDRATPLQPPPPAPDDEKPMQYEPATATAKPDGEPPPAQPARVLHLAPGDILIFEEVIGPGTGIEADADPAHRHVVRLTYVAPDVDPLTGDPVLEITWAAEDALPFPLCISATSLPPDCKPLDDVSVARGNAILVDHGRRVHDEHLGQVPVVAALLPCEDAVCGDTAVYTPGRFRPRLAEPALIHSLPVAPGASARELMSAPDPRRARPQIDLTSIPLAPGARARYSRQPTSPPRRASQRACSIRETPSPRRSGASSAPRPSNCSASTTARTILPPRCARRS